MSLNRWILAVVVVCIGSLMVSAQVAGPKISTDDEIKEDLALGPCKNDDRFEAAKRLFIKLGVPESELKVEKFKDLQNITFTKKGKTAETVIIGAHYDKVDAGCGIVDNWSGLVVMAHVYRSMAGTETEKTYQFVAFDQEEKGLKGSSAMAKAIPKESRANYCSMLNLDGFGLGYPLILENASTPSMIKAIKALGEELKVKVSGISLPGMADSDSSSFKSVDIPSITFSAMGVEALQVMHSSNDTVKNTNVQSVRVGYRFALRFLENVDTGACTMFRK